MRTRSQNGTRMIGGQEFLLNGVVTIGHTPAQVKANAKAEVKRMSTKHLKVRAIRRTSMEYAIYTHG